MKNSILLIPDKEDSEREKVAKAWEKRGGEVKRIGKFWKKPDVNGKKVALYGYDSFCLVLAEVLNIEVLMPKDEWIADVDKNYLKRHIEIVKIEDCKNIVFPKFIKPVIPKLFKAEIFSSSEELMKKITGIDFSERLISSDIIKVTKEVRSFILNKEIMDLAFYEGKGLLEEPKVFIEDFLRETKIDFPTTFVLDVGYNDRDGWFLIEFNSSWGAGLNFCDATKIIDCLKAATIN